MSSPMPNAPPPLPSGMADLRRRTVADFEALALDNVFSFGRCRACAQTKPVGLATNTHPEYRTSESFVEVASDLASHAARRSDWPRCECGGRLESIGARYHAFHSGLGRDLVGWWRPARWFLGRPSLDLLTWDPASDVDAPLEHLAPDDAALIARDASFRVVWGTLELGDTALAARSVEELLSRYPGDALLLRFVPVVIEQGLLNLAAEIANTHREVHPDDAEGHFWFGHALATALCQGLGDHDTLVHARAGLDRALALDPHLVGAAVSSANLLRVESRIEEAIAAFRRIVEAHPESSESHFNLGVMLMGDSRHAPADALAHFEAGEVLAPHDADFPIGCARALIALERFDEAREALERARGIVKTHPRFAEFDAVLAAHGRR